MNTIKEPSQATLRRRARKLAEKLRCDIEIERGEFGNSATYWVLGPTDIYDLYDGNLVRRRDPWDGDHAAVCWSEVLHRLEVYADDLALYRVGVNANQSEMIINYRDPLGLIRAWLDDVTQSDNGLVLADWFEEQGNDRLADVVRRAVAQGGS